METKFESLVQNLTDQAQKPTPVVVPPHKPIPNEESELPNSSPIERPKEPSPVIVPPHKPKPLPE